MSREREREGEARQFHPPDNLSPELQHAGKPILINAAYKQNSVVLPLDLARKLAWYT